MEEMRSMLERFAPSGRDLIAVPSRQRLEGRCERAAWISAIEQAERERGTLYLGALELL